MESMDQKVWTESRNPQLIFFAPFHIMHSTHLFRHDLSGETSVAETDDLTLDLYRNVVLRELERGVLHEDDVVVHLLLLAAPLLHAAGLRTLGLPLLAGLARGGGLGSLDALWAASLGRLDLRPILVGHLEPHPVGIVAGAGALTAAADPEVINAKTHTQPGGDFVGFFALLAARAVAEVERDADLARGLGVLGTVGRSLLRLRLLLLLLLRLLLLLLLVLLLFLFTLLLFLTLFMLWTLLLLLTLLLILVFHGKKVGVCRRHVSGLAA